MAQIRPRDFFTLLQRSSAYSARRSCKSIFRVHRSRTLRTFSITPINYLYRSTMLSADSASENQADNVIQSEMVRAELLGLKLVGNSGCQYKVEQILQEKEDYPLRVYLAFNAEGKKFVLKEVAAYERKYAQQLSLGNCPFLRLVQDGIPEYNVFVFDYLADHLLFLAQKDMPLNLTKRVLRDSLYGLATLHDNDIIHADIKVNNILVDYTDNDSKMIINRVQLADLEDVLHFPPRRYVEGYQFGNRMWRSPEAHAEGRVHKPSDIFSFAIVCIYAVTKHLLFAVNEEELEKEGIDAISEILERQLSYFGEFDSIKALIDYLGDNPWRQVFEILYEGFSSEYPQKSFRLMGGLDPIFQDLIVRLTDFDPAKRITAHEALNHPWFEGID